MSILSTLGLTFEIIQSVDQGIVTWSAWIRMPDLTSAWRFGLESKAVAFEWVEQSYSEWKAAV